MNVEDLDLSLINEYGEITNMVRDTGVIFISPKTSDISIYIENYNKKKAQDTPPLMYKWELEVKPLPTDPNLPDGFNNSLPVKQDK